MTTFLLQTIGNLTDGTKGNCVKVLTNQINKRRGIH